MPDQQHRRAFDRVGMRTAVTVVTDEPSSKVLKAWTDDLSPAGIRIVCEQKIEAEQAYFRVLIPGLSDQFFLGKTVRKETREIESFRGTPMYMHSYGVQFLGLCDAAQSERLHHLVTEQPVG